MVVEGCGSASVQGDVCFAEVHGVASRCAEQNGLQKTPATFNFVLECTQFAHNFPNSYETVAFIQLQYILVVLAHTTGDGPHGFQG